MLAEAVLAYAASIDGVLDTQNTYAEAIAGDEAAEWRQAMDAELQSHARNQTWTLVPRHHTFFLLLIKYKSCDHSCVLPPLFLAPQSDRKNCSF